MTSIRQLFVLVLIFFSSLVLGQTITSEVSSKSKKRYEEAGNLIAQRKWFEAKNLLVALVAKEPNFWEAQIRLANLCRNLGEADNSAEAFEKAVNLRPTDPANANAYYLLAEHHFKKADYVKAATFISNGFVLPNLTDKFKSELLRLKASVDFSLNAITNPIAVRALLLPYPVNQYQLQYFPVISPDETSLIFTARGTSDRNSDENIVISQLDIDGRWSDPVSISPKINTDFNEGTCSISADGRILIFTSCVGRDSQGGCDLYITEKIGDKWAEPKNLGSKINTRHWESQPSLSADGRQLYWATDRPGGKGKTDIWFAEKDNKGNWMDAINAGAIINTAFDELSPFIHFNQQSLFFASNGRPGLGGYDLMVSNKATSQWQEPVNLGYPLNDADDQMALVVNIHGTKGYYSKDKKRDEVSFSQIYEVYLDSLPITLAKSNFIKGKIIDEETGKPLKAIIELFDLKKSQSVFQVASDSITGDYLFIVNEQGLYGLNIRKNKYLPKSINFEQIGYSINDTLNILLSPIKTGSHFALRNIYFDVDKHEIKRESFTELTLLVDFLKRNSKIKIQIEGHTDNSGNSKYNLELSSRRAKSVYDYLITKGILPTQMGYLGLGDQKPSNANTSEVGKSLNRRIEIKVL